jgi:hypothetical protein
MKIRILSAVVGESGLVWLPGEIRSASPAFGAALVRRGRAAPASEEIQHGDPVAEHRDPQPVKRTRARKPKA